MDAVSVDRERWSPAPHLGIATVLEFSAATHVGRVRKLNEDAFLAGPPVFVVADGMGGYARGDLASATVVRSFEALVGQAEISAADLGAAVVRSGQQLSALGGDADPPGSTVVVAAFVMQSGHAYWLIAHAGDSRAYTWRAGELQQVTRDHSLVQELVDAGKVDPHDARMHPDRNVVTRGVGASIETEPEFTLVPVESGSRLVLCTDGLTSELSAESISVLLGQARTSRDAVDALLRSAVDAGGHDNVTVLVVDVVAGDDRPREDTLVPEDGGADHDTTPNLSRVR